MFPGRQDGRRRWIHWAMAEPLHIILPKVYWNSFVLLWLPSWLCAWGDWNSRVPVLFRTRVWRRMRLPLWSSPSTGSWKFRGRSGRWQSRCRRIQNRFKTGLNRIRWSRHKNEILFVQNDESDGEMEVPRANELFSRRWWTTSILSHSQINLPSSHALDVWKIFVLYKHISLPLGPILLGIFLYYKASSMVEQLIPKAKKLWFKSYP